MSNEILPDDNSKIRDTIVRNIPPIDSSVTDEERDEFMKSAFKEAMDVLASSAIHVGLNVGAMEVKAHCEEANISCELIFKVKPLKI